MKTTVLEIQAIKNTPAIRYRDHGWLIFRQPRIVQGDGAVTSRISHLDLVKFLFPNADVSNNESNRFSRRALFMTILSGSVKSRHN